jgi:adenine-specific DNA-methyltransferase
MTPRVPNSCRVYTPAVLASALVGALKDEPSDLWLEPCFGQGAFLQALATIGVSPRRIVAVDLDKKASDADRLATIHRGTEFLEWSLATPRRFSKIVANPPFVSFRRLSMPLHSVARRLNCHWAGSTTGNSNLWFAFLRASISLLKDGGSIGFIVPAAFDYAGYASTLRDKISDHFAEFEVHRCREPLFDEVQDGCVVLIGRRYELPNISNTRCEYETAAKLVRDIGSTTRPVSPASSFQAGQSRHSTVKVAEVLSIRIGCVTGDAQYFLLRESDRIRLRLPVRALSPVLTRSRHLKSAVVTRADWKKLKERNERVWLFRPHGKHLSLPSVRKYLRLAAKKGGCSRKNYKVQLRDVWYRPDLPARVEGFLSGSSRAGPWISLRQYERLSATNTLYCVAFNKRVSNDAKSAWSLSFLTGQFRRQLPQVIRRYPDGLEKIEPGDLMNLDVPVPPRVRGAVRAYDKAIRLLLSKGPAEAQQFVDDWFGRGRSLEAGALPS